MNSNSSKDLNETQVKYLQSMVDDKFLDSMSYEQKKDLINKTDNFLEAIYISPQIFDRDVFKILKYREQQLSAWRHNSQALGAASFLIIYILRRMRSFRGFYFRNFFTMGIGAVITGYFVGRFGEYIANKLYYQKILLKLAMLYNISDDEIEDLHYRINEQILKDNMEDQTKQASLDKVKFKF